MARVRKIANIYSRSVETLIHDARVVVQFYGSPYFEEEGAEYCKKCRKPRCKCCGKKVGDGHRGSCLSASFEIVAGYQAAKSGFKKHTTIPLPLKTHNGVTVTGNDTIYAWNQAFIHHYVWAKKIRLLELLTAPKFEMNGVPNREQVGLGWVAHTVSFNDSKPYYPPPGTIHTCLNNENRNKDDYFEEIVYALKRGRLPIVCIDGITPGNFPEGCWFPEAIAQPSSNNNPNVISVEQEDREPSLQDVEKPISKPDPYSTDNPIPPNSEYKWEEQCPSPGEPVFNFFKKETPTGHALVISGFENVNGRRMIRLIDPAPSMNLRSNPANFFRPNPRTIHPMNHIRWAPWDEFVEGINDHIGLIIVGTRMKGRWVYEDFEESANYEPNYKKDGPDMEEWYLKEYFKEKEGKPNPKLKYPHDIDDLRFN